MKTKKILLAESKRSDRDPAQIRPKRIRSANPAGHLPDGTTGRQRQEAVGLFMIGASAFSLSLIHYLQTSPFSEFILRLSVWFGMGVYIVPLIIGLMGIQRFLERSTQALTPIYIATRLLGCLGVLIFGLGLLGTEGGKLGSLSHSLATGVFGVIPTRVLFLFMTLSSLIFALDILYKDFIGAILLLLHLGTRVLAFSWEVFLALLAMFIEAARTTISALLVIWHHLRRVVTPQEGDSMSVMDRLLPFRPRMFHVSPEGPNDSEGAIGTIESFDPDERIPAAAEEGISERKTHRSSPVEISEESEASHIPLFLRRGQHPLQKDPKEAEGRVCSPITPAINASSSSMTSFQTVVIAGSTPTHPISHAIYPAVEVEKEEEDLEIVVALDDDTETEISLEDCLVNPPEADPNAPVYLDDNPIDREIRAERTKLAEPLPPRPVGQLPPLNLLLEPPPRDHSAAQSDLAERSALLIKTLEDFGIKASITAVVEGPAVSRFEIKPGLGVKVARITALADDIALSLAAQSIRIEAPIPGKQAMGIEIPNPHPTPVYFYDLIKSERFKAGNTVLSLALGVTISGQPVYADLTDMPHLLIAGSTGSGKSVCVNTIVASILFQARPDQVKFVMIDPKKVELAGYNGIPHLISPVVTDPSKAAGALLWGVEEMDRRYELLAACGVRKISTFNKDLERLRAEIDGGLEPMPFIVIIIDELADLMMTSSAEVEGAICRLAQMARAVGIHLVIATQRPSVNVLTGIIKANLPSRIAFSVASHIDSRTILDNKGAESLLGKGDMLFVPKGRIKPLRIQGAFISDRELLDITEYVKSQGTPDYIEITPQGRDGGEDGEDNERCASGNEEDADDGLMNKILNYLETQEKTSTSMLQRKFRIGYNRAARIMDLLEEKGFVSPLDGANKRRVIGRRSGTSL